MADTLQSEFMLYDIDVHIFFPPTMVTESWLEELKTKPALTHEIEGPDAGVSVDYAALTLYKGLLRPSAEGLYMFYFLICPRDKEWSPPYSS